MPIQGGYGRPLVPHEYGEGGPPVRPALRHTFRRLLTLGDPAPGGGVISGDLEISAINRDGLAPIVCDEADGEALFLVGPRSLERVMTPGTPTPDGGLYRGGISTSQSINQAGQVVWAGQVEGREAWSFLYDSDTRRISVLARPGMAAPGGGRYQIGGRQRPVINDAGQIAFVAHVTGPRNAPTPGVFLKSEGGTEVVARPGTPTSDGRRITAAEAPAINRGGAVAFHATIEGSGSMLGVYRWKAGKLTPIALPGAPVAGNREPTLEQAYFPQIDASGRIVFVGRSAAGISLYRWSNGTITRFVGPQMRLPGLGLLTPDLDRRYPFRINAAGAVAFTGAVHGQTGVFLWEEGKTRAVALSHVPLPRLGTATEVGYLSGYPPYGYGSPYGPPGGFAPNAPPVQSIPPNGPALPPTGQPTASGQFPPPGGGPYGAPGSGPAGPYGPPGGPGGPYSFGRSGSFGLALGDDGRLLFAALVEGRTHLVLATPVGKRPRQLIRER
jgi:hypothetical protein